MREVLIVFLGGGAGSALRYAAQAWIAGRCVADAFPWGTLGVNVAGCFLIGLFYALAGKWGWPSSTRLLLTAGLCGGFTTFSTFGNDTLALLRQGAWGVAALYVAASLALGVLAVWCGWAAARG